MKPVRPNDEADADFRHYSDGTKLRAPAWATDSGPEIQAAVSLISTHPSIGEVVRRVRVSGTVRRVPLRHFLFLLVYREYADYLEVVSLVALTPRSV